MSGAGDILKIIPVMQATALASANYKFMKKKKKSARGFVGMAAIDIIGASLINEGAKFLG